VQGQNGHNTIESTQRVLHSPQFSFSQDHLFQIGISPQTINILLNTVLERLHDAGTQGDTLTPSDVEEGATVVYQSGTAWTVGFSAQFKRRIRQGSRLILDKRYVSTHYRSSEAIWATVAGNGYCRYATLRQLLEPSSPRFLITDSIAKVLSWLLMESPPTVTGRIKEAMEQLTGADNLPRRAWCHIDLIEYFTVRNNLPVWTVGRTLVQSLKWLEQMHRMTPNPITSTTGMAYNGTDHFATFTPDITVEQRELAHRILELALNDKDLPEGWN
jgi:hypothetical protein